MRLAFLILAAWVTAAQAERVLQVETVQPERQSQVLSLPSFLAQIEAVHEVGLGFEIGGQIRQLPVVEGLRIQAGALIAELDTGLIDRQLEEIKAAQAQIQATQRLAKNSLTRLEEARDRGAITDQQLDEARDRLTQAQAQGRLIAAQRARVELQRDKHRLTAPFDGTVLSVVPSTGAVVGVGAPVVQFQSTEHRLRMGLPKRQTAQVGDVYISKENAQFTVTQVLPKRNSRTGLQDVLLDTSDNLAQVAGDWVPLTPLQSQTGGSLSLPTNALTRLAGQWGVYRVTPASRVEFVPVNVLSTQGERVQFEGALTQADRIVASGLHRMVPDQAITLKEQ